MINLFNIPLSNCFVEVLAKRFLEEYKDNPLALAEVLILLPNRRACKALAEAFVKEQGMRPTLLPQMLPLGEVEEDELFLSGANLEQKLVDLPPAIERVERLMLFTKIIMAKPSDFGLEKMSLNQACYLAQELANLLDMVENMELSFANLQNLVPEEYAAHWQETLKFLEIITKYWPAILDERGLANPTWRRNQLIKTQCQNWRQNPPSRRIVVAGTTATFPAMKELVATVLQLPQGEVILAGLEKQLEDEAWDLIDETHPQFELKELLDYLQVQRSAVPDLVMMANEGREKLIAEVMRPAKTTDKWRDITSRGIKPDALLGITLVDCADIRQEALAIAVVMREALETPEKTAALVTPDRNLARRVASELERWDIKVDDSAGRPLTLTPVGIYLRLLVKVAQANPRRIDILSLLKHPLTALGMDYATLRKLTRQLEQKVYRGQENDAELEAMVTELFIQMGDFYQLFRQGQASLKDLLAAHIKAAEALATTAEKSGEQVLWRGDAGEAAAKFVANWFAKAEVLGTIEVAEYLGLFEAMMMSVTVRPKFGTHPRLQILGPMEARLSGFDCVIIGGVNEGIWPQLASSDPWMSRPMKKDFGFPQPEKAIGVLGLDFSQLLAGAEVLVTRSERVQGTPMVKSRWWLRLETVLKALDFAMINLQDGVYKLLAKSLDVPEVFEKVKAPTPCPPVAMRPRKLSASAIETWMRDPYSIFAKYILKLQPLEEIEPDLTMADYGTIIHGILEEFNNKYPSEFPNNAREELLALGREQFAANNLAAERRAFWWPSFEKIVEHLVEVENEYRLDIKKVHNEVKGEMKIAAPAGEFIITAKADRVDETKDGKLNIIDYKTGKIRSVNEVKKGYAPQLPIEGLIAEVGGFAEVGKAEVDRLLYWQLGKKEVSIDEDMADILAQNKQRLQELIAIFDFPTTPYICQPNPKRIVQYSDYEHLARVKEWSVQGDADD